MIVRVLSGKGNSKSAVNVRNVTCDTKKQATALVNQIAAGVPSRIGPKFVDRGQTVRTVWADGNKADYSK